MRKEEKQFDLRLRSMLADAEETVSSGIWDSVSSRLDSISPVSARPRFRARYIGYAAAFAVAASLLTFILLPSPGPEAGSMQAPGMVAQVMTPESEPESADGVSRYSGAELSVKAQKRNKYVDAQKSPVKQQEKNREAAAIKESVPEEAAPEVQAKRPEEKRESPVSAGKSGNEQYLHLFEEDKPRSGNRHPVSIQVSGTFGTNNGGNSRVSMGTSPGTLLDNNSTVQETSTSTYGVPVSLGLGVRFRLSRRLFLGTGLEYSLLSRTFSGVYVPESGQSLNADFRHSMHYLGIPANLYFDVLDRKSIRLYVYGGAQVDYCVSNDYAVKSKEMDDTFKSTVNGVQFSVGGGVGLEFKISEWLGIYVDPGVRYYFNCHQPKNIHTEKPFNLGLDAGLRFNI